jgi:DNA ligase-1
VKRFVRLYTELDATTRTTEKLAALRRYLEDAPPEDAAWGVWFLGGGRFKRAFAGPRLRDWVAEASGHPRWLISECHDAVGDLAETIALLRPPADGDFDEPLHQLVRDRIAPLPGLDEAGRRELFLDAWRTLPGDACFVWLKLVTGAFRVGVQRTLLTRALAEHAGVDRAVMAHRIMGGIEPTAEALTQLLSPDADVGGGVTPYPFFLASPQESDVAGLGDPADWLVEWKWDGIRAQLVRRGDAAMVWSRGEEAIDGAFPEIAGLARRLPDGTVLDGEILAWEDGRPLPFTLLQQRLNRRRVELMLFADVPVRFLAFDVLESGGRDLREEPLETRRDALERIVAGLDDEPVAISEPLVVREWNDAAAQRATAREVGTEGLMLKRRGSPYRASRPRGDWWKWKVDPWTVDAVIIAAQRGHGRRASLLTDYTFGVWDGEELVPIAKAYSGLTDEEIKQVDRHLQKTTTARRGAYRQIDPQLVFELAFEGIQASSRHRSGIALRFPRMQRWRTDKTPEEADRLETLQALLAEQERRGRAGEETR